MKPYRELAGLVRAIAHPTRLYILDILSKGEACVCHLTNILEQRQPYVSQQLMILREAGLVCDRKEGLMVYYRLADERIAHIVALTREVMQAQGTVADFPSIPTSPVEGCPCPKCAGGDFRGPGFR